MIIGDCEYGSQGDFLARFQIRQNVPRKNRIPAAKTMLRGNSFNPCHAVSKRVVCIDEATHADAYTPYGADTFVNT